MNYRHTTILAREVVSGDETKVIDLNLIDPVSQIHIVYESLNGAVAIPTAHPAKCITKIELVDGSDVLFSLSGQEAQAADWYHRGREPYNIVNFVSTMYSELVFNLNFGRFLWDPLFAFVPKKFRNPQLKITIDINAGGTTGAGGYLTVLAHAFDGKAISPQGFLMHKEIKDYVPGASAHEYTDLPVDYLYRKLFVKAQKHETGPEYLINTLKLSEDNDKRVPISLTAFEILRSITALQMPYREKVIVSGGVSGWPFFCTPCYWPRVNISQWESHNFAYVSTVWGGDGGKGWVYLEVAGGNYIIDVEGWAPHGVIEIPFGLQDDPADWYDVTPLGSLRLDILAQSGFTAGDSCSIFLQQLRKY